MTTKILALSVIIFSAAALIAYPEPVNPVKDCAALAAEADDLRETLWDLKIRYTEHGDVTEEQYAEQYAKYDTVKRMAKTCSLGN